MTEIEFSYDGNNQKLISVDPDPIFNQNIIDITQLGVTWTEGHVTDHSVYVRLQGRDSSYAAGAPARGAPLAWSHCCAEILYFLIT